MKKLLSIVAFMVLFLAGCSNNKTQDAMTTDNIRWTYDKSYSVSFISEETTQIKNPKGIIVLGDEIYVSDFDQNAIVVLDKEGIFLRKVGQLGSAPGEFIGPTGITADDKYIYVIDSGNNRVQIFDRDFQYVDSIELPQFPQVKYCNIAIDESGYIYASNDAIIEKESQLVYGNAETGFKIFKSPFSGSLFGGEKVYALDSLEFSNSSASYGLQSGENMLYLLNGDKTLSRLAEFPYKYTPACFAIVDDQVYCLSVATCTLDVYKSTGEYVKTLYNDGKYFQNYPFDMYMAIDNSGNIFINNYIDGGLIKIYRGEISE